MLRNPDVTVRSRGVMEKCTYCVQRINETRIGAEKEGRPIEDGEIVTACQQACPSRAIVFETSRPENSRRERDEIPADELRDPRGAEHAPPHTYLAKLRNPKPGAGGHIGWTRRRAARRRLPPTRGGFLSCRPAPRRARSPTPSPPSSSEDADLVVLRLRRQLPPRDAVPVRGHVPLREGRRIYGVNIPVGWGWDITNFVWWIGIGHAGTLISAILLLLRQHWRNSINRFAEAMTLFAVACRRALPDPAPRAAVGLLLAIPVPSTMGVWPQFRSPLVWDVFAVSTYATVSTLFWFVGLVPDLATLRDRSKRRFAQVVHGILAMAWRGSARRWQGLFERSRSVASPGRAPRTRKVSRRWRRSRRRRRPRRAGSGTAARLPSCSGTGIASRRPTAARGAGSGRARRRRRRRGSSPPRTG